MTPCQALDDYLDHDLTGDDLARFTAHLPGCAECRRAVREQQRLAVLLAEAAEVRGRVPAGLTGRIGHRLWVARRRRLAAAAMLTAAAAVVGLLVRPTHRPVEPAPAPMVAEVRPTPDVRPLAARVRVTIPADAIVVPEQSDSPNVTFLRVYPGLRAGPRPAPSPDDPSPSERISR